MTTLTIEQKENLTQRCIYIRRQAQEVAKKVLAAMLHRIGYGSEFGSYYSGIQKSNCAGCPDCPCDKGPSLEEARRDFRVMLDTKIGGSWFGP